MPIYDIQSYNKSLGAFEVIFFSYVHGNNNQSRFFAYEKFSLIGPYCGHFIMTVESLCSPKLVKNVNNESGPSSKSLSEVMNYHAC